MYLKVIYQKKSLLHVECVALVTVKQQAVLLA